ncbi:MAG TPA: hypothetical protein VIH59_22610 [Candidatus Tectomicrobia bacterium]
MLTQVTKTTRPNTSSREQVERKMVVICNVAGRDVASMAQDIQRRVDPLIATQPGYTVAYGGQFDSAEEAGRLLTLPGLIVVLGISLRF